MILSCFPLTFQPSHTKGHLQHLRKRILGNGRVAKLNHQQMNHLSGLLGVAIYVALLFPHDLSPLPPIILQVSVASEFVAFVSNFSLCTSPQFLFNAFTWFICKDYCNTNLLKTMAKSHEANLQNNPYSIHVDIIIT